MIDEQLNGLVDAIEVLKDVRGIAFSNFTSADVVRHPLVARIVDAYAEANTSIPKTATKAPAVKPAARKNVAKK